ncbi:hypothetical protein BKI52_05040 [marine bacterium AO1-C]|nr:hypothetical protein BKI52_05040 [marine bacterium AO1-C]
MSKQNSGLNKNSKRTMNFNLVKDNIFQLRLYMLLGSIFFVLGGAKVVYKPKAKLISTKRMALKPKPLFTSSVTTSPTVNVCPGIAIPIGNIVITEGNNNDFNGNGSIDISLGSDFTLGGTINTNIGGGAAGSTITTSFPDANTLRLTYSFTGGTSTNANTITIGGLEATPDAATAAGAQTLNIVAGTSTDWGLNGSEDLATVNVYARPATPGTILGVDAIFSGETTTLIIPEITNAVNYEWDLNGATSLTVEGSSNLNYITYRGNVTASEVVNVRVRGIAADGCVGDFSANFPVTISPTGLDINAPTIDACNDNSVTTLPDIVLTEKFFADFANGAGTLVLELSNGTFQFQNTAPTVTFTNEGTLTATVNTGTNTVSISYDFTTSQTAINSLIISGLQVMVANSANTSATLTPTSAINTAHFSGVDQNTVLATINREDPPADPTSFTQSNSILCTDTPVTFEVTAGAPSYEWELPSGVSGTSSTNSISVTASAGAANGNVRVRAIGANGCKSEWLSQSVTIEPSPANPSAITGEAELCVGTAGFYYIDAIPGVQTYQWEFPLSKFSSTDDLDDTDNIMTTSTPFIRVNANQASVANTDTVVQVRVRGISNNCGTGAYSTTPLDVTIKAVQAVTINGANEGDAFTTDDNPITLSATPAGGVFSGQGVSGNQFFPSVAGEGARTIRYTYTPASGCPAVGEVTVIVSALTSVGLEAKYCEGDNGSYNFSITRELPKNGFDERYIVGLKSTPGISGSQIIPSTPNCNAFSPPPNNSVSYNFSFNPAAAGPGEVKIQAYVVTEFTLGGPILLKDLNSSPTSSLIPIPIGTDCNVTLQTLATITVLEKPNPVINPPSGSVCADGNTEYTYSVPVQADRTYLWNIGSGGTIVSGANTNQVTVTWNSTNNTSLSVTETNSESSGTSLCETTETINVNVQDLPTPAINNSSNFTVCAGATETYSASAGGGNIYKWTATNGVIVGSDNNNTVQVLWADQNGTLTVTTTNSSTGCEGSDTESITVDTGSSSGLTGPNSICGNSQDVRYTISNAVGGTIAWAVDGGSFTQISPTEISVDWGAGPLGKVEVRKTTAACVGIETVDVAINALPVPAISNLSDLYCETEISTTFIPSVDGSTTLPVGHTGVYLLEKGGNDLSSYIDANGVMDIANLVQDANGGTGTYSIRYRYTSPAPNNCTNTSSAETFNIIAKPDATFTFEGLAANVNYNTYCASDATINLTSGIPDGFYTVTPIDAMGNPTGAGVDFARNLEQLNTSALSGVGRYSIIYTFQNSNGCQDVSDPRTFEIFPNPDVAINTTGIQPKYCVREVTSVLLQATATINGNPATPSGTIVPFYEVRRISGSRPTTNFEVLTDPNNSNVITNVFNPSRPLPSETAVAANAATDVWNALAGQYEIRYTFTDANGCQKVSDAITIEVEQLPEVTFTGLTGFYCIDIDNVDLTPLVNGQAPPTNGTSTFNIRRNNAGVPGASVLSFNSNNFDPSGLGAGEYFIDYTFAFTGGCTETSTRQSFTVGSAPMINFSFVTPPANNKYCIEGGGNIVLSPDQTGGIFTFKKNGNTDSVTLAAGQTSIAVDLLQGIGAYQVTYTFTDINGCKGTSNPQFFNIVPLPTISISGINPNGYCVRDIQKVTLVPNITVESAPLGTVPTLNTANAFFEIRRASGERGPTGYVPLTLPGTTTLTDLFDPSNPLPGEPAIADDATTEEWNAIVGEYVVRYTYQDVNGCRNQSPEFTIKVNRVPKLTFTGLAATYCDDVNLVTLTPFDGESRITSSVVFKYRNTTQSTFNTFTQGNSFSPKTLGAGTYEVVLESSASGCNNTSQRDTTYLVTIQPTPKNVQVTATQTFGENKIQFVAGADNTNANWTWEWDFRDGTLSNERSPLKTLITIAPQVINYTFIPGTEQGCTKLIEKSFKMEFDVENLCVGAATKFTNKSELPRDQIGSIMWDFGDGQGTSTETSPSYSYSTPGTYIVKLTMTTQDGVATYVLNRRVDIFPLISVSDTQFYNEEFENGNGGWISHGVVNVNQVPIDSTSWKLKQPDGFLITNANGNAWVTDNRDNANRTSTDANYNSNEQSYVESPCFDIGGLNKPMISFRYWSDTDQGSDGVALLYTIDDGKTWTRLGEKDLGINWYDTRPILGAPGEGSSTVTNNANSGNEGWSGRSQTQAGDWKTARFSLTSVLIAMQQQGITNRVVRFRMVFGSNADNPPGEQFDGFAFDGVRISNRNRIVLLEYFINAGVNNAATFDLNARRFPDDGNNNEIISIHNHTGFPGLDDINTQNDKDPSARAFYHGIRDVPRGVLDGTARDTLLGKWATDLFADRTLIPSPFLITINQPTITSGQLNVSASIQALEAFDRKVVMHMVVIDSVTTANGQTFYNATRKFLPDAAGTYRDTPWVSGDIQNLNFDWNVGGLDPSNFRIVVFIEDYDTREVHQAGVISMNGNRQGAGGGSNAGQVTGILDPLPDSKLVLYPNPASNYLQVKLEIDKPLSNQAYWEVITLQGQVVKSGAWVFNQRSKMLNTSNLAEGVYILRIIDQNRVIEKRFTRS